MNSCYVHHYDKIFDRKIVEGVNKIRSLERKKICNLLVTD